MWSRSINFCKTLLILFHDRFIVAHRNIGSKMNKLKILLWFFHSKNLCLSTIDVGGSCDDLIFWRILPLRLVKFLKILIWSPCLHVFKSILDKKFGVFNLILVTIMRYVSLIDAFLICAYLLKRLFLLGTHHKSFYVIVRVFLIFFIHLIMANAQNCIFQVHYFFFLYCLYC